MKTNKFNKVLVGSFLVSNFAIQGMVSTGVAAAPMCGSIFTENLGPRVQDTQKTTKTPEMIRNELLTNYKNRNEILSKRYPQLDFVFKDPEAFVQTMKSRFEAQKKITPEDPRLFDFPEAASTMKEIRTDLEQFRMEISSEYAKSVNGAKNIISVILRKKQTEKIQTLRKMMDYIDKLHGDIDGMISSNKYPYRDTVYSLYYYSRVRGFYQFKELNIYHQITKYIDMHMHGYRPLNIKQEMNLFETKGSPIVQVRSTIAKEFRMAELPFKDAFERRDSLEYVIIPSVYALGSSAFMHVLPHKIHFLGATNTPIKADGFDRPGGLFWMHDVRHEADRYMKYNAYKKAQGLSDKQMETMSYMMQKWHAEFLEMKNSVTDKNLKESLDHYHFYTHHDIGFPLIPSMFLNHHRRGIKVYYAFLFHKHWAKENVKFNDWFKVTEKTQKVLEQFWRERLPQEKEFLKRDPVTLKEWSEWFPKTYQKSVTEVSLLNRALENKSTIRLMTSGVGVEGNLSKVHYGKDGTAAYVVFEGPARLVDASKQVIAGQGTKVHAGGYSTPIGTIQKIDVSGKSKTLKALRAGDQAMLTYASGVVVKGEVAKLTFDAMGEVNIVTFKTAEVVLDQKVLYKPEWGSFDMTIGKSVDSVEFLVD